MLWEDALTGYWLERRRNLSPATVASYEHTFRRFRAWLGTADIHIEQITSDHVRKWLAFLGESGLAPKSVANDWITLSAFWTWAAKELQIPHIIRDKVRQPPYKRPSIVAYTRQEVGAMLNAATRNSAWTTRNGKIVQERRSTANRDRAILLTLLDTGLRATELCNLQISDYEAKQGRLHIRHGNFQYPLCRIDSCHAVRLRLTSCRRCFQYQLCRIDSCPQPIGRSKSPHSTSIVTLP